MNRILLLAFVILYCVSTAKAQSWAESYLSQYNHNIQQEYINDVYIPADVDDAIAQLDALSNEAGRIKMMEASEDIIADRLVYGLGKWMIVNWNFYDGSRLSHHLKSYGVTLPDDMARFLIMSYYRHLKGEPLELEERGNQIYNQRKKEQEIRNESKIIISEKAKFKKQ